MAGCRQHGLSNYPALQAVTAEQLQQYLQRKSPMASAVFADKLLVVLLHPTFE
jgi:hypothetical protein